MTNFVNALATRVHQAIVEPALVLMRRKARLGMFGFANDDRAEVAVEWHRPQDCRAPCPLHADEVPRLLRRYAAPGTG